MQKIMNEKREYLNHIYNIISDGNYEIARKKISKIKEDKDYHLYNFEIDFLENYLNESEYFNLVQGTKVGDNIVDFLYDGKNALYYEEYDDAVEYFTAGAYLTDYPLFYFLAGRTLMNSDEKREEAVEYLEKYIRKLGASKAYLAYELLGRYYKNVDEKKSKKYIKNFDKLSLIMSINKERKDERIVNEEINYIKELAANQDYAGLINAYENSYDSLKIRIIGELYKAGFINQADKLYKNNRRKLESNKNNRKLIYQLDKNKTLFKNKGKHSSTK